VLVVESLDLCAWSVLSPLMLATANRFEVPNRCRVLSISLNGKG